MSTSSTTLFLRGVEGTASGEGGGGNVDEEEEEEEAIGCVLFFGENEWWQKKIVFLLFTFYSGRVILKDVKTTNTHP